MSIRRSILSHTLPLIPTHSFTRQALVAGYESHLSSSSTRVSSPSSSATNLASMRSDQAESVIDEIFGPGRVAVRALVKTWEAEGQKAMNGDKGGNEEPQVRITILDLLKKRLEYSALIGTKPLLDAHALLSTPTSTLSLPIPSQLLSLASSLSLPLTFPSSPSTTTSTSSSSTFYSSPTSASKFTIPRFNPLGSLTYAWRVADHAIHLESLARSSKKGPQLNLGNMGEERGAGAEWYVSRLGLGLVYLASEAYLLQSSTIPVKGLSPNPNLSNALNALTTNMSSYDDVRESLRSAGLGDGVAPLIGFAEFVTRSWAGLIRSRGF